MSRDLAVVKGDDGAQADPDGPGPASACSRSPVYRPSPLSPASKAGPAVGSWPMDPERAIVAAHDVKRIAFIRFEKGQHRGGQGLTAELPTLRCGVHHGAPWELRPYIPRGA